MLDEQNITIRPLEPFRATHAVSARRWPCPGCRRRSDVIDAWLCQVWQNDGVRLQRLALLCGACARRHGAPAAAAATAAPDSS